MVTVLDPPMPADGRGAGSRIERDLARIVGHLTPRSPQAGAGVAAQGAAGDAHDAGDERPPVGVEVMVHREDLDVTMLLATMRLAVNRGEVIGRGLDGAQVGQAFKQARLVVLDPHQQRAAGRRRGGEGFFDSAAHRR
jgi:hypothetical protein